MSQVGDRFTFRVPNTIFKQRKEGTEIVCKAYETFHNNYPPIDTLPKGNAWFNPKRELIRVQQKNISKAMVSQWKTTAMSFANIVMTEIETNLI